MKPKDHQKFNLGFRSKEIKLDGKYQPTTEEQKRLRQVRKKIELHRQNKEDHEIGKEVWD